MATRTPGFIPAYALTPDTTGRCFIEPYSIKATNDLFRHDVLIFNDPSSGQEHGAYGVIGVPDHYLNTPVFVLLWTSTAITGNCRWRLRYRSIGGDDAESLDQASYQETVAVTDAAPSAAHERMEALFSLTAGNLAPGDLIEFYLTRLDDTGVDTMAAAAIAHAFALRFNDA